MVGLIEMDLTGLEHLVLDTETTLTGPPPAALFSPCAAGHEDGFACSAREDVSGKPCRVYRYALTRTWGEAPPAVFIMLNPSTADAFKLDPTLRRCAGFAKSWGCGGMTILNAFGLRSTKPAGLRVDDPVGPDNDQVITTVLAAETVGPVIVAWGSDEILQRTGRATAMVELLRAAGVTTQCLHLTKDDHPGHPLYLRGDTRPVPYPSAMLAREVPRRRDAHVS